MRSKDSLVSWVLVPCLCASTMVFSGPASAVGGKIDGVIHGPLFVITAEANGKTGSATVTPSDIPLTGEYIHNFSSPLQIVAGDGTLLGRVDRLTCYLNSDPVVSIGFAVTASNVATNFTISSAIISFGAVTNASATASGGTTLTDNDGNGATLIGGYLGGTKSFQPSTNLGPFSQLVRNLNAGGNMSDSASEAFGWSTIFGNTTSMASQFAFTLSANDQASGTGVFALVVPEPSGMIALASGVVGLAGLLVRRRII